MALRSTLSLYAYTSPTSSAFPPLAHEYGESIEALEFTTVAPGGFGDLACMLKLRDARLPRPELGLFARAVLRDGLFTCFSGEWSDPALVLDGTHGDYVLLSALGGGVDRSRFGILPGDGRAAGRHWCISRLSRAPCVCWPAADAVP